MWGKRDSLRFMLGLKWYIALARHMWGKRDSLSAKVQGSRGGFAEIDEEVTAVLAFVISHTTFLAAQDDETGRYPKDG